jgi:hypothetical protein
MANVEHKNLADSERHEPKGISVATAGEVYFADGAAGGDWRPVIEYATLTLNDNAGVTVNNIGTSAQKLAIWDAAGPSSGATASALNDDITINTAGDYVVKFHCSAGTVASPDAGDYQFRLRINGSESATSAYKLGTEREFTGTNDIGHLSFFGIVTLAASDVLTIWIESDEAGDTDDIKIYESTFTILKVGV